MRTDIGDVSIQKAQRMEEAIKLTTQDNDEDTYVFNISFSYFFLKLVFFLLHIATEHRMISYVVCIRAHG